MAWHGTMILTLMDSASFLWSATHALRAQGGGVAHGGGNKALSGELTQLQFRCGGQTFDAGSVNISYL